nr:hypothetical protein GCM10020185_04460 [Pseudomonas brassicacearum subsp. brassicacearum]
MKKIDIEHDQAQGAALTGAPAELDVQGTFEQTPVRQPGEAVMGGNQLQRLLSLAQVRFDPFAVTYLAHEYPAEQANAQHHQADNQAGLESPVMPPRQDRVLRHRSSDHQRISL